MLGGARFVIAQQQKKEFIHTAVELDLLLMRKPKWRKIMRDVFFKDEEPVEFVEKAEEQAE